MFFLRLSSWNHEAAASSSRNIFGIAYIICFLAIPEAPVWDEVHKSRGRVRKMARVLVWSGHHIKLGVRGVAVRRRRCPAVNPEMWAKKCSSGPRALIMACGCFSLPNLWGYSVRYDAVQSLWSFVRLAVCSSFQVDGLSCTPNKSGRNCVNTSKF